MSREGDLMRRALKRVLVPSLKNLGFVPRAKGYHRADGEFVDLLMLQYWKYGGEFILEFARRGRGPMQTSWGPLVQEEDLDVGYLNPLDRARLEQIGRAAGPSLRGFQYAGYGEDAEKYNALATEVAALLPQVDLWLKNKQAGPNVHPFKTGA